MKYWLKYTGHERKILGKRKQYDANIYTFDIETTSYIILNNEIKSASSYLEYRDDYEIDYGANMYIWMLGINNEVYYGRTWEELKRFLKVINDYIPEEKFFFIHNLSFEFQFLKGEFRVSDVIARKSRKVMSARLPDYNITMKCTYFMTNTSLERLAEDYRLPIQKKVGDLDYSIMRNKYTPLTEKELTYCEYDCLVVYHYILKELDEYKDVKKIPMTSTGHVRRELKEKIKDNYKYKKIVRNATSDNPHVYNLLLDAFTGGFVHANWLFTATIYNNVDSWDITSSYPFCMVSEKYPMSEFKRCHIEKEDDMLDRFAYILVIKMYDVESKLYNNFISKSKCRNIRGGRYDNGRIIKASELEITITDIDFRVFKKAYNFRYEIIESYYSLYKYLPRTFINFILAKYKIKTEYKGIKEKEDIYMREKQKFNALYGMSVTNTIRDEVIFDDITKLWNEVPLDNDDIMSKLKAEKNKGFMNFAWGIYVTSYARRNLLERIIDLDEYVIYTDTDSLKLREGYDENIILEYNKKVEEKLKNVSEILRLNYDDFSPVDKKGNRRLLGIFDKECTYDKFITQGAKKYATETNGEISVTCSGVPKKGAKALKKLEDFTDDFVFDFKDTNKNTLVYIDDEKDIILKDFLGNESEEQNKSGCCLLPTTYKLGKSHDYVELLTDNSSERARYKE